MHEGGNDFVESNNEESLSEISSCTLTTYSPLSDLMEADYCYETGQVIDPLRFPHQDGDEMNSEPVTRRKREGSTDTYSSGSSSRKDSHNSPKKLQETSTTISNQTPVHSCTSRNSTPKHSSINFNTHSSASSKLPLNVAEPSGSNLSSRVAVESKSSTSSSKINLLSEKCQDLSLTQLGYRLPSSKIYEPETVDFPSSPTAFHSFNPPHLKEGVVRLAEGESETSEQEFQEKFASSLVSTPPTGLVQLRKVERPKSLEVTQRKRLTVTEELLSVSVDDDQHSVSSLSYNNSDEDDDAQMLSHEEFTDMLTPDDIDTPDELEESIMERLGPADEAVIPQAESSQKSTRDEITWRAVVLSGIERRIDMKVIEPYKKVLSHGGYMVDGNDAIIIFSACFLPDRSRRDYDYVMDHLFMYVLTTLDQLIVEDYVLVYLHGATTRANMPSFAWLKRCYQMIDRRLRKNLQGLYLVHPTFWVKTVVVMTRPFVSSKFARKLRFISSLKELYNVINLDEVCIPSRVKQYDNIRESLLQKK